MRVLWTKTKKLHKNTLFSRTLQGGHKGHLVWNVCMCTVRMWEWQQPSVDNLYCCLEC